MSQWVHVIAVIRYDGIEEKKAKKILGKMYPFSVPSHDGRYYKGIENYKEDNTYKYIPMGSEGSLEYKFFDFGDFPDFFNPELKRGDTCAGGAGERDVIIKGDLRRYSNVEYIKNWFLDKCKKLKANDGVIRINDDYADKAVVYDYDFFRSDYDDIRENK